MANAMQLLAQIAPQRGSQYSALASTLAPFELQLSSIGKLISASEPIQLAGQAFLKVTLSQQPSEAQLTQLGELSMCNAFFVFH